MDAIMNRIRPLPLEQTARQGDPQGFELDQLLGLALTDSRFFRQLQEHPREAAAKFELTQREEQAILGIAPLVESVEELAVRLDAWRTCEQGDVAATYTAAQPARARLTLSSGRPSRYRKAELVPEPIFSISA